MKKFIVLFALFACLIPLSVSLADICETKCCGTSGNCSDQDAFCKTLLPNNYASTTACINENIPASCGATETKICCCSKAMGSNDLIGKDVLEASAQNNALQAPITSLNFTPEISIPGSSFNGSSIKVGYYSEETTNGVTVGKMNSDLLSKYVQAIYNYGLAIIAILAAIVLMGGGLLWLTSGGDSSQVNKAKEMIIGSITGLIILFCAWIILNTVNPELLKLRPIETVYQTKVNTICCEHDQTAEMLSEKDCQAKKGAMFSYLSNAFG
ncbi:MAG: pilin, partial [Patescibacteria group bacterium]